MYVVCSFYATLCLSSRGVNQPITTLFGACDIMRPHASSYKEGCPSALPSFSIYLQKFIVTAKMVDFIDVATTVLRPIYILLFAAYYIPIAIYTLLVNQQFSVFLSPTEFKDAWFAIMWKDFGPGMKEYAAPMVRPLMSLASGVVIGASHVPASILTN